MVVFHELCRTSRSSRHCLIAEVTVLCVLLNIGLYFLIILFRLLLPNQINHYYYFGHVVVGQLALTVLEGNYHIAICRDIK